MKQLPFSQVVAGGLIVAIGLGFFAGALGLINFGDFLATWWPSVLIIFGIAGLLNQPRQIAWPVALITFGLLQQLNRLGIITFDVVALFWPSVLIYFGASLLIKAFRSGDRSQPKGSGEATTSIFVALSGVDTKSHAADYLGGSVSALLGGVKLDLREAVIAKEATLKVSTIMGGVELWVPRDRDVRVSGTPLMGGWEDKTAKPLGAKAPILHIDATCVMGGIEIKN